MDSTSPSVRHHPAAHRFESGTGEALAVAEYQLAGDRMIFTHTYVPPSLRGRGIAEELVRAGLDEARRTGRQVVPQCSYVARFVDRHREYADLLAR